MFKATGIARPRSGSAAVQSVLWGARAASWARIQEGMCRPLFDAGLRHIGIRSGMRHLDIGCGAGEALWMSQEMGAAVFGFDATEPLVRIAEKRVPAGEFRIGEMEELPYADGSFDTVTGFNSFQFALDPLRAVAEARRVTKKDGRVLIAAWGRPEDCDAAACLAALKALLPAAGKGSSGPFAFSADGALKDLAVAADLDLLAQEEVQCAWLYADLETALEGLLSAGPASAAIKNSGEEAVRSAMTRALEPYERRDGTYKLMNAFRYLLTKV